MTYHEEVNWGNTLQGKQLVVCIADACRARPAQYQPVIGLKEQDDIMDDLLGIMSYCNTSIYFYPLSCCWCLSCGWSKVGSARQCGTYSFLKFDTGHSYLDGGPSFVDRSSAYLGAEEKLHTIAQKLNIMRIL